MRDFKGMPSTEQRTIISRPRSTKDPGSLANQPLSTAVKDCSHTYTPTHKHIQTNTLLATDEESRRPCLADVFSMTEEVKPKPANPTYSWKSIKTHQEIGSPITFDDSQNTHYPQFITACLHIRLAIFMLINPTNLKKMYVQFTGHDQCDLNVNLGLLYDLKPAIPCSSL